MESKRKINMLQMLIEHAQTNTLDDLVFWH